MDSLFGISARITFGFDGNCFPSIPTVHQSRNPVERGSQSRITSSVRKFLRRGIASFRVKFLAGSKILSGGLLWWIVILTGIFLPRIASLPGFSRRLKSLSRDPMEDFHLPGASYRGIASFQIRSQLLEFQPSDECPRDRKSVV